MANEETTRYADIFAALGSEPRLEIMRLLFAAYPTGLTVGDIQAQLKIPNSTLSHHLEKLRVEGLVSSRRDKQFLWYSANAETFEDLLSFLYNGCSIGNFSKPDIANQVVETVQPTSREEGFMFERFLRSLESLYQDIFAAFFLPREFERFTQKAIQVIFLAQDESRRLGHQYVGTEQILLGLISEDSGIAAQVLSTVGVNLEKARIEVEKIIGNGRGTPWRIPFTPRAKRSIELSIEESRQLGHNYIGTEHLLLGILRERDGLGARVLQILGVDLQNLEQQLRTSLT
ncbi:MAG TPA: Clp protease [Cyanobacteria bacterium UBA8543]|nr:Clp protease [Cyanobacteria bacterium UBA8543]